MTRIDPSQLAFVTAGIASGPTPWLPASLPSYSAFPAGILLQPGSVNIEPQPQPWTSGVYLGH
jgi:hypothetical protein